MALNNPAPLSCQNIVSFDVNKTPNITAISGCNIGCRFCKCLVIKPICGKTGIRTLGTRKGTTVFETVPIDHSGIFPLVCWCGLQVQRYNLFGIVCKYFGQFFGSCCVTALYFQSDEVTEKAVCFHRARLKGEAMAARSRINQTNIKGILRGLTERMSRFLWRV